MVEIICSGVSLVSFMAFLVISSFGKNNKKWSLIKNICLVILAFMQVMLLRYSNLSGAVGNFITMYMAFWLLA